MALNNKDDLAPLHPAAETVKQLDQTVLNFEHVKQKISRMREVMPDVFPLMKLGRLDELGSYSPGKAEYEADTKKRKGGSRRRLDSPDSADGRRSPGGSGRRGGEPAEWSSPTTWKTSSMRFHPPAASSTVISRLARSCVRMADGGGQEEEESKEGAGARARRRPDTVGQMEPVIKKDEKKGKRWDTAKGKWVPDGSKYRTGKYTETVAFDPVTGPRAVTPPKKKAYDEDLLVDLPQGVGGKAALGALLRRSSSAAALGRRLDAKIATARERADAWSVHHRYAYGSTKHQHAQGHLFGTGTGGHDGSHDHGAGGARGARGAAGAAGAAGGANAGGGSAAARRRPATTVPLDRRARSRRNMLTRNVAAHVAGVGGVGANSAAAVDSAYRMGRGDSFNARPERKAFSHGGAGLRQPEPFQLYNVLGVMEGESEKDLPYNLMKNTIHSSIVDDIYRVKTCDADRYAFGSRQGRFDALAPQYPALSGDGDPHGVGDTREWLGENAIAEAHLNKHGKGKKGSGKGCALSPTAKQRNFYTIPWWNSVNQNNGIAEVVAERQSLKTAVDRSTLSYRTAFSGGESRDDWVRVTGQAGLDPGTYDYTVAGQVGVRDPASPSRAFLGAGHQSIPFIDADTGTYTRRRDLSDGFDVTLSADEVAEERARRADARRKADREYRARKDEHALRMAASRGPGDLGATGSTHLGSATYRRFDTLHYTYEKAVPSKGEKDRAPGVLASAFDGFYTPTPGPGTYIAPEEKKKHGDGPGAAKKWMERSAAAAGSKKFAPVRTSPVRTYQRPATVGGSKKFRPSWHHAARDLPRHAGVKKTALANTRQGAVGAERRKMPPQLAQQRSGLRRFEQEMVSIAFRNTGRERVPLAQERQQAERRNPGPGTYD